MFTSNDSPQMFSLSPLRWAASRLPVHLHVPWTAPICRRGAVLRDCAALGGPMAAGRPSASLGRRFRLLELLLGPLLALLISGLSPALGQKVYTNTWAVHIPGGQEEADQVASKYGFINHGHVSKKLHFTRLFKYTVGFICLFYTLNINKEVNLLLL